jgi:hypothetical protein
MSVKTKKSEIEVFKFLEMKVLYQTVLEKKHNGVNRKQNGVFYTNSISTIDKLLDIVEIDSDVFNKKILEPSCGQGIFLLILIGKIYSKYPDELLISNFIGRNLFFVDIDDSMVKNTIDNISEFYLFLFGEEYKGPFNGINWDFTDKKISKSLVNDLTVTPFSRLYGTFDFIIGNPPYVTLYGRRDKKKNEEQRLNYLKNYEQFPDYVKNGKINLVMLFIEHSLDLLKQGGEISFIIDVSFFETAYVFTRKFLLEQTIINELQVNIKDFDVASGQIIIKVTKDKKNETNQVKIIDWKTQKTYTILQSSWYKKDDEYKFRYNSCNISKNIIDKINAKRDNTILQLFTNKNLRTCVMLLDMEDKFTFINELDANNKLIFPYYQGSKSLSEKFGELNFTKYFYYNKPLQDKINEQLKLKLEKEGIKNKKRIGLGETIIYENPKVYIRQSAKEIIASLDLNKSSANNSLYVFSLRNNTPETIDFLYFLCGWLNTDLITYYAQQMNIIRFSQGKQPQIKISDLGTIFIPTDKLLQNQFTKLTKSLYETPSNKNELKRKMNELINEYYGLTIDEIEAVFLSLKDF